MTALDRTRGPWTVAPGANVHPYVVVGPDENHVAGTSTTKRTRADNPLRVEVTGDHAGQRRGTVGVRGSNDTIPVRMKAWNSSRVRVRTVRSQTRSRATDRLGSRREPDVHAHSLGTGPVPPLSCIRWTSLSACNRRLGCPELISVDHRVWRPMT